MKKTYTVTVTTYKRTQPSYDEVFEAVRSLVAKKVDEAPKPRPAFLVEVSTVKIAT